MMPDNKPHPVAKRGRGPGSHAPPAAVTSQPRNRPHDAASLHVKRPRQPATSQEADVKWRALLQVSPNPNPNPNPNPSPSPNPNQGA